MDDRPRPDILVLCGVPGSGKTYYAEWLQRRDYGRVSIDDLLGRSPADWDPLERAAMEAINGEDAPLRAEASHHAGIVIEWGFHPSDLGRLATMVQRGYVAWYFDADRQRALEAWRSARPGAPDHLWQAQIARLDDAHSQIAAIFGPNLIETIPASGRRLTPQEIDELRRGRTPDHGLRPDTEDR